MQTLQVDVGHTRYPITIGPALLGDAELLASRIPGHDLVIVTNTTVARLYLHKLRASLSGRRVAECVLPDGEQYKTLQTVGRVFDSLVEAKLNRDATVLALGGGAIEAELTRALLKGSDGTLLVHLEVALATTLARCGGTEQTRPVLADQANLAARYERRLPLYRTAHVTIAVDELTPTEVADAILRAAAERGNSGSAS